MTRQRGVRFVFALGILSLLGLPRIASAQVPGSIAGTVRDSSGAVLPGVTVEAASPALIEKVREVVTDGQGEYKIVGLRPGTYSVTFTLTGFSATKREGIELNAGFTAPVNAELRVGAVEETITVSGATPVVDVQNVRSQSVMTEETLNSLPTGAKTLQNFATLILGATNYALDVGGTKGENPTSFGIHGTKGSDSRYLQDGMILYVSLEAGGNPGSRHGHPNQAFMQETVVTTGSASAETETGGPQINLVPKDGGNRFTGYFSVGYSTDALQGSNLTDELEARNLHTSASTQLVYDIYAGVGGPIKQNKLWFYAAHRKSVANEYQPNAYWNATQGTRFYTPDLNHQAAQQYPDSDQSQRITWQASSKQKFAVSNSVQKNCNCYFGLGATTSPEASGLVQYWPIVLTQGTWSYPATSRLLLEAGLTFAIDKTRFEPAEGVDIFRDIPMFDVGKSLAYNSRMNALTRVTDYTGETSNSSNQQGQKFTMSYITGSHAFKVGFLGQTGYRQFNAFHPFGVRYEFLNNVPNRLTQSATPNANTQRMLNVGVYGQDQWTVNQFTVNAGLRMDWLRVNIPAAHLEAGPWVPARDFAAVNNVPNWTNYSPRLGLAYDLFGNGKTAIKTSLGRYMALQQSDFAFNNTPANQQVLLVNRTWNDSFFPVGDPRRGNFLPDCDLKNTLGNDECGQMSNLKFGTVVPTEIYDRSVLDESRGFSWQHSTSLTHEVRPGLGLSLAYYRTWYGNFLARQNTATTPADYDTYCVTAPTDTRLGSNSGQQICGLYDVKPAKFGQVSNVIVKAKPYGKQSEVYNGVDVSLNARFGGGRSLQGGVSVGRTSTDTCYLKDVPNVTPAGSGAIQNPSTTVTATKNDKFCHVTPPWSSGTQVKLSGVYPLPVWDLQTSATFQNLPGATQSATMVFTNAQIAPSLGRNLGACGVQTTCNASVNVLVTVPNSLFENRVNQIDWRLAKTFRLGGDRRRVQGMLDVYNVLNTAAVTSSSSAYPSTFLVPSGILGARLFRFGVQVDF